MKPSTLVVKVGNYNYLKDDLLGQGSSGKVYLGVNSQNQQKVAIKIIEMDQIDNEVTKYLLQCEKQALTIINNPNVLRAHNIYQQKQQCFIITQYCSGGNLKEYILKNRCLHQTQAMTFFFKILKGYKSIKQNHFVHRDLKSSNIMLIGKQPIIIDFGYCQKTYGNKPKTFYNVGSPSYMSPQAFYKTTYSEKSDIWALGVILYEMLTGYTIDKGQPINRYFSSLIKNGYKLPSQISDDCKKIVDCSLKINPQERLKTTELLDLVANYFEKRNQKNILHSFSTADVSQVSSPHNNPSSQKSFFENKKTNIHNHNFEPHNKNHINRNINVDQKSHQPPVFLQQRYIKLYEKQRQSLNNQKVNEVQIQKETFIKNQKHVVNENRHFLNQNVNKVQQIQRVNYFKGFPDPLSQTKKQQFYEQKPNETNNSIVIEKNRIMVNSCIPQIIHINQSPKNANQLWNSKKMTQSIIINEKSNSNIQENNSHIFERKRVVQSMHEGIKMNDSQHIRNSVHQQPQGNPYFHQQLCSSLQPNQERVITRHCSQNQPIGFQGHNPHMDFMSNAHNAFIKKNKPDVQVIQNNTLMKNNKMVHINVVNQPFISQPQNLVAQRRF